MKSILWAIVAYFFLKFGDKLLDRLFDYFIDKYTLPWIIRIHQAYKKNAFQLRLILVIGVAIVAKKTGLLSEAEQKQLNILWLVIGIIVVAAIAQKWSDDNNQKKAIG